MAMSTSVRTRSSSALEFGLALDFDFEDGGGRGFLDIRASLLTVVVVVRDVDALRFVVGWARVRNASMRVACLKAAGFADVVRVGAML